MENSSVYMCFPCYQEFNTLDEVLQHQLTCTAEATEPPVAAPGITTINAPVRHTQVKTLSHTKALAVLNDQD